MVFVVASVVMVVTTALVIVDLLVDVGRSEWMRRDSGFVWNSRWCEECPFVSP